MPLSVPTVWLLPVLAPVSGFAARAFYRVTLAGWRVPATGPVLLVANHPNSLLDPALVAAAARRPVRFLAKAPLFTDRSVGWLVRAAGAIPVFRAAETPDAPSRNTDMFRAVHHALAGGDAVGIFPEGTTHNAPSLVSLKTGAARMALGAAAIRGGSIPIVPVGLTLRDKERFRSEALVAVGEPVAWDDLAAAPDDPAAVRELTTRIEQAIRRATLNLERWEDRPTVEFAEAVYAAEFAVPPGGDARVRRLGVATAALARLRASDAASWRGLAEALEDHRRALASLGATPESLRALPGWRRAAQWTLGRGAFWTAAGPLLALGSALFWLPYRAPGWIVARLEIGAELRATYKTLLGFVAFVFWWVLLSGAAGLLAGWGWAAAALAAFPAFALATLALHDRWRNDRAAAVRFVRLRRSGELRGVLLQRQQSLAAQLHRVVRPVAPSPSEVA